MAQAKTVASTQEHLDIEDIRDDMVILKNGSAVMVLQTNAVNFDLLSENEQDAMIFAYAALLNSLSFPIQVIVRSKIMDVSSYLFKLDEARRAQTNPALADMISKYQNFIRNLIAQNQVLDKRFYLIIPYLDVSLSGNNPLAPKKKKGPTVDKWQVLEKARVQLAPKRDHLLKQMARIGIRSWQLDTQQLVELFYEIYNPNVAREQKVSLPPEEYTVPIVEPAIETGAVVPEKP
jgi:hypothetical protein